MTFKIGILGNGSPGKAPGIVTLRYSTSGATQSQSCGNKHCAILINLGMEVTLSAAAKSDYPFKFRHWEISPLSNPGNSRSAGKNKVTLLADHGYQVDAIFGYRGPY